MKCTSCQSENSASSKYCWACGARLTVLCPACKESNTVRVAFAQNAVTSLYIHWRPCLRSQAIAVKWVQVSSIAP